MSDRKRPRPADALARLTPIEAPEFLDQLVLERALPLLEAQASRPKAPQTEPELRWVLPRLKSS